MSLAYDPDAFRYCIYCGADCSLGLMSPPDDYTPPHDISCPAVTGIFPVTEDDLEHGMMCTECDHVFTAGDSYAQLRLPDDDPHPTFTTVEVVCIICAAKGVVTP